MPTRNINLTPEMDAMVAERIAAGEYANASEVIRAGLRALRREEEDRAKLQALREALIAGERSGWVDGEAAFERVLSRMRQKASAKEKADVA